VTEFLNMGGHGGFIWSSWGIALVVLATLVVASVRSMRIRERELARMEAEAPRRRRRGASADADNVNAPETITPAGDNQ
jgi:heme exporter protein D